MIRRLELRIKAHTYGSSHSESWKSFLIDNYGKREEDCVYFANLEWLVLDMREWYLKEDRFLVVCHPLQRL